MELGGKFIVEMSQERGPKERIEFDTRKEAEAYIQKLKKKGVI